MSTLVMTRDNAEAIARLLERTSNAQGADNHLVAYLLRVMSVMLRETPEDHMVILEATFQPNKDT